MGIPYNPELCSRSIIDNPQHLEWALSAYTACAKFFIYSLPKQGRVHPRGHRVRSGKSMALKPRATETRLETYLWKVRMFGSILRTGHFFYMLAPLCRGRLDFALESFKALQNEPERKSRLIFLKALKELVKLTSNVLCFHFISVPPANSRMLYFTNNSESCHSLPTHN